MSDATGTPTAPTAAPATGVLGIHHVTAIAGDAQANLDFYTRVLGLRLVKRSVNQDAPTTYHLFYADAAGTPGTDITFFPWPEMGPGRSGAGLAEEIPFAVPPGSLAWWAAWFDRHAVARDGAATRFSEPTLPFADPHGLRLALVETAGARPFAPWPASPVPEAHQIRGMHAVRLVVRDAEPTARFMTGVLGFTRVGEDGGWTRYAAADGGSGTYAELRAEPGARLGAWGTGVVHHVAWRVPDATTELAVRAAVADAGLRPTETIDRFWFQSVYFREPGGVLFELATDGPGFARDEDAARLGERLILPPWLEPRRADIEAALPPLRTR